MFFGVPKALASAHFVNSARRRFVAASGLCNPSLSAAGDGMVRLVKRWIQMALAVRQSLTWMEQNEICLARHAPGLCNQEPASAICLPTRFCFRFPDPERLLIEQPDTKMPEVPRLVSARFVPVQRVLCGSARSAWIPCRSGRSAVKNTFFNTLIDSRCTLQGTRMAAPKAHNLGDLELALLQARTMHWPQPKSSLAAKSLPVCLPLGVVRNAKCGRHELSHPSLEYRP